MTYLRAPNRQPARIAREFLLYALIVSALLLSGLCFLPASNVFAAEVRLLEHPDPKSLVKKLSQKMSLTGDKDRYPKAGSLLKELRTRWIDLQTNISRPRAGGVPVKLRLSVDARPRLEDDSRLVFEHELSMSASRRLRPVAPGSLELNARQRQQGDARVLIMYSVKF